MSFRISVFELTRFVDIFAQIGSSTLTVLPVVTHDATIIRFTKVTDQM